MNVMINGLNPDPKFGQMAAEVVGVLLDDKVNSTENPEFVMWMESLTGPEVTEKRYSFVPSVIRDGKKVFADVSYDFDLIKPDQREERIREIKQKFSPFIAVDFTHPSAVNDNADFYCRHGLPFVMGTTGGDRKALEERVRNSEIVAVIAPNMAKQIVALQQVMEDLAKEYQGRLTGCTLEIKESHQYGKADTSGTAKAMVGYFNQMGIDFNPEQIVKVRDPEEQLNMGVPERYLTGHAWHNYTIKGTDTEKGVLAFFSIMLKRLITEGPAFKEYMPFYKPIKGDETTVTVTSPDRTVHFAVSFNDVENRLDIIHNVNGRLIYALGALDAIRFAHRKVEAGEKGKVYTMIDVLRGN